MLVVHPWLRRWFFSVPLSGRNESSPHDATQAHAQIHQAQEFESFFWRYEGPIGRYLWHMTGNKQVAFDLSQETFLRAWRHFASIKDHPQVQSWLFRVATNLALTARRRAGTHYAANIDDFQPATSDPGNHIAERELVRQTLQMLTPKQRSTLLLHEVHGFSCDEIGHLLDISGSAVKMALYRAREQFRTYYLRACLKKERGKRQEE
jgi:RNA polymerase sigma-70 factor, ECF subfamily